MPPPLYLASLYFPCPLIHLTFISLRCIVLWELPVHSSKNLVIQTEYTYCLLQPEYYIISIIESEAWINKSK